ncbi:hypothetical protein C5S32_02170 [ANME-1 cluster archaeon GoMg1]|nr:hypothetical protein [ANME-1 cluster archaeon GoMg1]
MSLYTTSKRNKRILELAKLVKMIKQNREKGKGV